MTAAVRVKVKVSLNNLERRRVILIMQLRMRSRRLLRRIHRQMRKLRVILRIILTLIVLVQEVRRRVLRSRSLRIRELLLVRIRVAHLHSR